VLTGLPVLISTQAKDRATKWHYKRTVQQPQNAVQATTKLIATTDEELLLWDRQDQKLTKTNYFEVTRYIKISKLYNQGNAFDPRPVHVGFVVDEMTLGYIHTLPSEERRVFRRMQNKFT
jgi:hypothetical protein